MADRSRYFETWAYRPLLRDYFAAGARWLAAPKPQLSDDQYDASWPIQNGSRSCRYAVTELEPTFDAADFVRCGRDIFAQVSHVTNHMGIEWVRKQLGEGYRVHNVYSRNPHAMHIDDTLMPLAPGKVLVNPVYMNPEKLPEAFAKWDVLLAPQPLYTEQNALGKLSGWMNMNVLMLDPKRVIVERSQEPTIRALEQWGFEVIPCAFEAYYFFVGSFHCATLDIRRRGTLESYF
jgi:glycine amidinotransferase